jgi:hypothetical protein
MKFTSPDLQDSRLLDVVLNVTDYPLSRCNSITWTVRTTFEKLQQVRRTRSAPGGHA